MPTSPFASLELIDADDQTVRLPHLWRNGPVLLFLMRHFGCGLCRQHMLRLRDNVRLFEEVNCSVAVIAMGDATLARTTREIYRLPFPVYVDPSRAVYKAFEIGEGSLWDVAGPHILLRQIGPWREGISSGNGPGPITQLGGLVILDGAGLPVYRHVANPIYRYPAWADVAAEVPLPMPKLFRSERLIPLPR